LSLRNLDDTTTRARDLPPIVPPKRVLRLVWSPDPEARGRSFALDGQTWSLGRGASGDGCIRDGRMSREHVRLMPGSELGSYLVKDLGSSNGTFLDGRKVFPDQPAFILAGQVLSLGGDTLLVVDQEPDPDSLPAAPDADPAPVKEIVGVSFFSDRLRRSIVTVARARGPVLVLGETGTGKEVTAGALHRLGPSPSAPLCAKNCASIDPPDLAEDILFGHKKGAFTQAASDHPGLFDQADGGTLFLDEIGRLPESAQAKLLRTLEDGTVQPLGSAQSHTVSVRVVGATNEHIDAEGGSFRRDLYARLSTWVVRLSSLAERRADVLPLFEHFVRLRRPGLAQVELTGEFAEALLLYAWPENVRQVRNLADRVCELVDRSTPFDVVHLPEIMQRPIRARAHGTPAPRSGSTGSGGPSSFSGDLEATIPGQSMVKRPDRGVIEAALAEAGGNVAEASRSKGWHATQLRRWVDALGIDLDAFRRTKKK
jgi:two-component system NtrC family response regulator